MSKKQYGQLEKQRILMLGESGKLSVRQVCKRNDIPEQTYYRWRREALASSTLFALRLRGAKTPVVVPDVDEDDDSVTGAHMSEIPAPESVGSEGMVDDECPEDFLLADLEFLSKRALQAQPPKRRLMPRGKYAVEIHGQLERDAFKFIPLALPNELRERLDRDTLGSLNQTIVNLVRYALDALESDKKTLHLFNLADGVPAELD